jgi:hypothetical protein
LALTKSILHRKIPFLFVDRKFYSKIALIAGGITEESNCSPFKSQEQFPLSCASFHFGSDNPSILLILFSTRLRCSSIS